MTAPYPFLLRKYGRGRSVCHLTDERGEALCGLRLGEQWELARVTRRRVCRRCLAINTRRPPMDQTPDRLRRGFHHRPPTTPAELARAEGRPLSPRRLLEIQRSLPEEQRFAFLLALDERLAKSGRDHRRVFVFPRRRAVRVASPAPLGFCFARCAVSGGRPRRYILRRVSRLAAAT